MRVPHTCNCSIAAARNVSAAHNSTLRPSDLIAAGQLPDGGGFARAVDAHHDHDGGRLSHVRHRPIGCFQDFQQMLRDESA